MMDSILPKTETTRNVRDMTESRRALELRKYVPHQNGEDQGNGGDTLGSKLCYLL
jgi:hypothetical protein